MEREEKKYEVLPGVKTPDIKTILDAASDFTNPGVDNVMIKGGDIRKSLSTSGDSKTHIPSQEEIQNLQNLGDKVAADELRAMEESRKKMDEIMQKVMAPESMKDLRKAAASKIVSEEKREQLEKERAEIEAKQAEEDAKNKAREERKLAQQKVLEETKQKKAEEESKRKEEEIRKQKEEELRKKKEALEKAAEIKKAEEKKEAEKKAAEEAKVAAQKAAEDKKDDDYKAWVKAKKEAEAKDAAKKEAEAKNNQKAEEEIRKQKEEDLRKKKEATEKKTSEGEGDSQTLDDFSEFL